ncbi:MAG TPA: ECF transporter S component [Selenomonadales bacterium]|nr:ECF transporter S component [Selenomonadales bacterium]
MFLGRKFTTKDLVYIGVFSAMLAIGTSLRVPFGVGAMVHLGTAVIFIIGILYGGVYAGLSAAIGSALFDLVMGFSPYTLWSFFIKGLAGLIVGTIAKGLWPEAGKAVRTWTWLLRAVAGCLAAAAWTLGGYIVAWWQVTGSLAVALNNVPGSLMTSLAGFIAAMLLTPKLRGIVRP